jgi:hypothetical protein
MKIDNEIHKLDQEMVDSLMQMVQSADKGDQLLALSIVENLDTRDEFTVLSINKINKALIDKCNGWYEFIELKNKAREMTNGEKDKYSEYL